MGRPGIAANLFNCLCQQGINLRLIATSEVKVSCVIDASAGSKAVQAVQDAFDLEESQIRINPTDNGSGEPEVRGVALDRDQVQLSVRHVPDRPAPLQRCVQPGGQQHQPRRHRSIGAAAQRRIAGHHLHPAQGRPCPGRRGPGPPAGPVARSPGRWRGHCPGESSVLGCRQRQAQRVACSVLWRMRINIGLIATSEIRTSCVVAEEAGVQALQVVHAGFGLGGEERHTAQGTASPHDAD